MDTPPQESINDLLKDAFLAGEQVAIPAYVVESVPPAFKTFLEDIGFQHDGRGAMVSSSGYEEESESHDD